MPHYSIAVASSIINLMKLNGHEIAEKIYYDLLKRVEALQKKTIIPHLVVILVGENPASVAYVNLKQKKGEEIGAKVTILRYPETVTTNELVEKIKLLNDDPFVHGILIQRPLPEHLDVEKLELTTAPEKDIDGFHPDSPYTLPLPLAVVNVLEEVYYPSSELSESRSIHVLDSTSFRSNNKDFIAWLSQQNIVLLGKGPTGGGPILAHLTTLGITPTVIDRKTPHPEEIMKQADIIIAATGRENMVTADNIKKGVILVGVGVLRGKDGKLTGDYNEEEIKNIASYYTPTPKGVGPINVALLMQNLITAAERQTLK